MERMSTQDAGFYFVEDENSPMHVGSVAVFEGPPPAYGDLVRLLVAKLPRVPRYRQRVRTVPLHLGRPMWIDDEHFEILYHVRHTAVPAPGGEEQLRNLAGRVFAQRLDTAKPLWEMWLVEGLQGGRWAIISKVHHCMIDGVAGWDLAALLLDTAPEPEPLPAGKAWRPWPASRPLPATCPPARRSSTSAGACRPAHAGWSALRPVPSTGRPARTGAGNGRRRAWGRSSSSVRRSAAPSTTWSSRPSPEGSATCWPGAASWSTVRSSARWFPCLSAPRRSGAR